MITLVKKTAWQQNRAKENNLVEKTATLLPEYRSQTDGLRELLSSIDRNDQAWNKPLPPFDPNLYESPMHLPHSAPGLPGSPDLPIGPTRWGLYISGAMSALAMLFVSALVFSHITSPTGINWAKVKGKTVLSYQWLAAGFSNQRSRQRTTMRTSANDHASSVDDILEDILDTNETVIATASRISTTAASVKNDTINTPTAAEIFVSPQELESQIQALERVSGKSHKRAGLPASCQKSCPLEKEPLGCPGKNDWI